MPEGKRDGPPLLHPTSDRDAHARDGRTLTQDYAVPQPGSCHGRKNLEATAPSAATVSPKETSQPSTSRSIRKRPDCCSQLIRPAVCPNQGPAKRYFSEGPAKTSGGVAKRTPITYQVITPEDTNCAAASAAPAVSLSQTQLERPLNVHQWPQRPLGLSRKATRPPAN